MSICRVIQVIQTTLEKRGDGSTENPQRNVTQYYSIDGKLLAEIDPKQNTAPTNRDWTKITESIYGIDGKLLAEVDPQQNNIKKIDWIKITESISTLLCQNIGETNNKIADKIVALFKSNLDLK